MMRSEGEWKAEDNIKVMCRFRPLNNSEKKGGSTMLCKFAESNNTVYWGQKPYTFDKVFQPETGQEEVYLEAVRTIVTDVLSGFNGTVFAYGQTSSGKTHTMEGVINNNNLRGVIPRIVGDIFDHIYSLEEDLEFLIKVSYFEIYLEKIRDLLDITKINLSIHEDENGVPYIRNLTEIFVSSKEEIFDIIAKGKNNRQVAVTDMNEHSSRSHCVFLLTIKQENKVNHTILLGKLYLIDLAGSEKIGKTGAEGTVLEEAKYINKSLSALGNVINALSEGKPHIPYRDSKLTRVLQESLGGNSRTTVIICCSPASYNQSETKSTLEFGIRAKTVKNIICVNEEVTSEEWKSRYQEEAELVKRLMIKLKDMEAELNRWRSGENVPVNERIDTDDVNVPPPVMQRRDSVRLDERRTMQQERDKLYKQLDEKDEEINQQSQLVNVLKDEMLEQEDLIATTRKRLDLLQRKMDLIQKENESAKDETKDVLQALEELAINYDHKAEEFEIKNKEYENVVDELMKKQYTLNTTLAELRQLKETSAREKKSVAVMMNDILKDLREIDIATSGEKDTNLLDMSDKSLEDEFTEVRLYTSKMKSKLQNLLEQCNNLESMLAEGNQKMGEYEKGLTECRMINSQYETRVKILQESVREAEDKRRAIESDFDALKVECVRLKTAESQKPCKVLKDSNQTNILRQEFDIQLKQLHNTHQQQFASLRYEIMGKQTEINELKNLKEKYYTVMQQLQRDNDNLKKEGGRKCSCLQAHVMKEKVRDNARREMKGLEDTVARELQTLHNLRKLFVQDLQARMEDPSGMDESGDFCDSTHKQTIHYLEDNLDQLIAVNRQLVRDNADLRCEVPKLERHLRAAMDRVNALENALKEAKESAVEDRRKRYMYEIDRIKESMRIRSMGRRKSFARIAKPIRVGNRTNESTESDTQDRASSTI